MDSPFVEGGDAGAFTMTPLADAKAVVDVKNDEIRITVPLPVVGLRANAKPATRLVNLGAAVSRAYGAPWGIAPSNVPHPGNLTTNWSSVYGGPKVSYALGTPSCVPVGR